MDESMNAKEEIVSDFVEIISEIDSRPCDEIELEMQKIVQKTRGLIHEDLKWSSKSMTL